jgi:hypothetical protein
LIPLSSGETRIKISHIMRLSAVLLGALLLTGYSIQLYGASSKVVKLTAANFKEQVLNSKGVWLVEFYGRIISISSLVWSLQKLSS